MKRSTMASCTAALAFSVAGAALAGDAQAQAATPMSYTAGATGTRFDAAAGAVRAAGQLGLLAGSALYSDVESYNADDTRCADAVRAYWSGWTRALHGAGYLAGVYGSQSSAVRHLAASHSSASLAWPDVVWNAQWNNAPTLLGWSAIPDAYWPEHQRIKQFRGDGHETYGGVTLYTDRNVVDAPVATVAHSYRLTGAGEVPSRLLPYSTASVARPLAGGSSVRVVCRTSSQADAWSKLADGTYLPGAAVTDGPMRALLPLCTIPHQITAALFTRAGPSKASPATGTMTAGAPAWVTCRTPGITLGGPGYWHRLDNGSWVSGAFVATRAPSTPADAIPLCPSSPRDSTTEERS